MITKWFQRNNPPTTDMQLWEYALLVMGVSLQCICLVLVFCMVSSGLIYMIDFLLGKIFGFSIL